MEPNWNPNGTRAEASHEMVGRNQPIQAHHARMGWKEVKMTKVLSVLLLAVLAVGVMGSAQTAVTPRTAEGVLLFDNQTGMTVTGINILFEQDVEVDLASVVVVGGGNVTILDVEGRSVWIDVEVEPEGTLSLGLSSDYVGAQIKSAHWFASMEEKNKIITLRLLQDLWNGRDLKTADELVSPNFHPARCESRWRCHRHRTLQGIRRALDFGLPGFAFQV